MSNTPESKPTAWLSAEEGEEGGYEFLMRGDEVIGEVFAWGSNCRWNSRSDDRRGVEPTFEAAKAALKRHLQMPDSSDKPTTTPTEDAWILRRFGRDHAQPCKRPEVLTCAMPKCQKANACQASLTFGTHSDAFPIEVSST